MNFKVQLSPLCYGYCLLLLKLELHFQQTGKNATIFNPILANKHLFAHGAGRGMKDPFHIYD